MKTRFIVVALCVSALTSSLAIAQVSKCTDANGKVSYQDGPCQAQEKALTLPIAKAAPTGPTYRSDMVCKPTQSIEPKSEETIAAAKSELNSYLKDPFSAKAVFMYARLECSDGTTRHTACGLVNAKNAYGGYTGSKVTLYSVDTKGKAFLWQHNEDAKGPREIFANLDILKVATACLKAADAAKKP